jgi:hypothetical protein
MNNKYYCEDCGQKRPDEKAIKAYCPIHLKQALEKEKPIMNKDLLIKEEMEKIMESEPMKWLFAIESQSIVSGRLHEYKGAILPTILLDSLSKIYEEGRKSEMTNDEIVRENQDRQLRY